MNKENQKKNVNETSSDTFPWDIFKFNDIIFYWSLHTKLF